MIQALNITKPDAKVFGNLNNYEYFCDGTHLHYKLPALVIGQNTYNALNIENKALVFKKNTDQVFPFSKVHLTVER